MGAQHETTAGTETTAADTVAAQAFIARWQGVTASELSTSHSFVIQLCELLGVAPPHPTPDQRYMFERPITFTHGDGSTRPGRIDCYLRGHFVWESKKLKAGVLAQASGNAPTRAFDDALLRARQQAEDYARALPASEGRPPFVVVVDVGHVIELYAEFTRSGATYTPFPDPRSHRIRLPQLADPLVRARLKALWTDPLSLDPSRVSARVTREVAAELAALAKSLEAAGHTPHAVAGFLTRCLFSMFAEDVGLLPPSGEAGQGSFMHLLRQYREQPATLTNMLRVFWQGMDAGGFNAAIAADVLRFNGKLFKGAGETGYVLPLTTAQIDGLLRAASANWTEVEPAIFGTLLERALDPAERHALGAHYTPRAYVERLVLPTVVEPLRADWANAQAAALVLAHEAAELEANPPVRKAGTTHETFDPRLLARETRALIEHERKVREKWKEAREEIRRFHHQLCTTRVLDPACGSGNFLYVTLEHLKRLEGEVLNQLQGLGAESEAFAEGETVTLKQFLGIELNERAAALAELVLWIGWLQWHVRTRGLASVAEPVVHDYRNIENRDAVLAWDQQELATDEAGKPITRWDGATFKKHPVTGENVPDEAAQVPQWRYLNPRPADWPAADFIVGNPPFIGASAMRSALGDGYVQALRATWVNVPESADFVMHWWHHAASLVRAGAARRFGFITTNSLRQTFNRRVVQAALDGAANTLGAHGAAGLMLRQTSKEAQKSASSATGTELQPLALVYAIPDHPWVDSANGAAVRIAMTVGAPGAHEGRLLTVQDESDGEDGEVAVNLLEARGLLHADLRRGANVASAVPLLANAGVSSPGVKLHGAGFIVTRDQAKALLPLPPGEGRGEGAPHVASPIREYRNGRDLMATPRDVLVIDLFGLSADEVRQRFPAVYQWVLERVKPERDQNNRATYRDNWWIFGEPRKDFRPALAGLSRYIATVETSKHRAFQFLDASVLPDNMLIATASPDALHLGVLSSQVHVEWALAAGGRLGVGNDPRYNKSRCFEPFPFPSDDTGLTPELTERIRHLAEQLDAHRKRVLDLLPSTAAMQTPTVPLAVGQSGAVGADLASAAPMRPPQPPADTPPATPDGKTQTPPDGKTHTPPAATAATAACSALSPAVTRPAANGLTLTGLYNLLDKLRRSEPLTAKDKVQHEQGLVSVLQSLHDELDTAVLAAYGWSDLGPVPWANEPARAAWTETLLERLVALNARRAAEEAAGTIRWLRPDFQDPARRAALAQAAHAAAAADAADAAATAESTGSAGEVAAAGDPVQGAKAALDAAKILTNKEQTSAEGRWLQGDFDIKTPEEAAGGTPQPDAVADAVSAAPGVTAQPWPATLPEQVRALAAMLAATPTALPLPAIEARFKGRGPWKRSLPRILETLEALGRARREGDGWRG